MTGTINLPDPLGNTPFSGTYDTGQETIRLLRPFPDGTGSVQDYTGTIFYNSQSFFNLLENLSQKNYQTHTCCKTCKKYYTEQSRDHAKLLEHA
jgi:hypothetical protein